MSIWKTCQGSAHITPIDVEPCRVVESQSTLTIRDLVDTREEHDVLASILEASKPAVDTDIHYLLFTPFRYPPLKYGSRFGRRFERSLWYGSLDIGTALSEVAYYRLLFLHHTEAMLGFLHVSLTSFSAKLGTDRGINLCAPPFNAHEERISSKTDYAISQELGTDMRNNHVHAFIFRSARSHTQGLNVAAFTPDVFHRKNKHYVFNYESWHCVANQHFVHFSNQDRAVFNFSAEDMLATIAGETP